MPDLSEQRLIKRYALLVIIFFSVLFRVAAAIYMGNEVVELPGAFDQISYHQLALRVASGQGFTFGQDWWPLTGANQPTAHWSYLYTLFLTLVYKVMGPHPLAVRLIQAVLVGILQPYLAFLLGKAVMNRTVGLIFAGLTTGYAYFIYYAATLMTEPFYITAVMASLYLTIRICTGRKRSGEREHKKQVAGYLEFAVLGIILGMAVLLRQVFLLVVPILFIFLFWIKRKESVRGIAISTLIIVLLILPFAIYNNGRFDRFVLLNTNAGFAFFWANHPIYGAKFQPILSPELGSYQDLIPHELRHLDEAALDQALLQRGTQFVFEDPLPYVILSVSRIPAYFKFWPSSDSSMVSNVSRVGSFGLLLPFMVYGMFISWKDFIKGKLVTRPAILILFVFIGFYSMIHLLSWALIRYRLPVDAIFLLFASYGILDIVKCAQNQRKCRQ